MEESIEETTQNEAWTKRNEKYKWRLEEEKEVADIKDIMRKSGSPLFGAKEEEILG